MSGANLEVECLSFSSISRPEHRSSSKSWFGAETEDERSEPEDRAFRLAE